MRVSLTRLHQLLESLSSLFRASLRACATRHDLKLVQLEALIFLGHANRYSDTPASVADYLGLTKGTTGQTLRVLESRGLLERIADADDGRVSHLKPTAEALPVIRDAYPAPLLDGLSGQQGDRAAHELETLLRTLQRAGEGRTFGVCRTCRHFQPRRSGGTCGLTGERLLAADTRRLCREHEQPREVC